jgi:hypothetical protein
MRVKSLIRSLAAITFVLLFVLSALARPVMAQSDDAVASQADSQPFLQLSGPLSFTNVPINTTSASQPEIATDPSGKKKIKVMAVTVSTGFTITNNACSGTTLKGNTCEVDVACMPTTAGPLTGQITFNFKTNKKRVTHQDLTCTVATAPTPSATATQTATATATPTATATATATATNTATATRTATSTATATNTATSTATATNTATQTATSSATPTETATSSETATSTATSTATATQTATSTSTSTGSATPTSTATATATATPTNTATATSTSTSTGSATPTSTGSATATATATNTATATATNTATATATPTNTATATSTGSATPTSTGSATATATNTATATRTATATATPTTTATATNTATATATATNTATATTTATGSSTATATNTATRTATATVTATGSATPTATATATSTATATATATSTATATATATTTATATSTGSSGPTPTATSTPGAEAGSILIAGGDTGGTLLGGGIHLATGTVSSQTAQIFNTATDTFLAVGNLNTKRESAAVVALPNDLTLIVGGETCAAASFGGTAGFQCNALNTAELYNESTQSFSFAGSGSSGVMTVARSGPSATLIEGSGTDLDGQVLIVGGSTGSSFLSTSPPPGGSGAPPANLVALHNAELYNPATDAFTATTNSIPGCAAGVATCATGLPSVCPESTTSTISTASESGTTVTIVTTGNPATLAVGAGVTISNVSCPSCVSTPPAQQYNGSFTVATIPDSTHFTYTSPFNGTLTAGSGGTAAADDAECGMVDQGAALIPNDNGKVLIAGGDILAFLGQSSNLAFLFDPSTQTFTRTTSMTNARELFPLTAITNPPATGSLVGQVVAMGGIQATSAICLDDPSIPVLATTLNSAEVYDPATATWSATTNNMFVARTTTVSLLSGGHDTGEIIVPGGVDVEAGTEPSTCAQITALKQKALSETELYDPTTGAGGTFTATGSLNQPREGQSQGELGAGNDITDFLVAGGACTTPSPSLQSVVIGTSQANTTCGTPTTKAAQNDYSEIYNQMAGTWTVGPTFASGFSPSNAAATAVLP